MRIIAAALIAFSICYAADNYLKGVLISNGYQKCIKEPITKDSWCKP